MIIQAIENITCQLLITYRNFVIELYNSTKVASTSFKPFNCVNFEIREQKLRPRSHYSKIFVR